MGREAVAAERIAAIARSRSAIAAAVAQLQAPRQVVLRSAIVLQRDPLFLVGGDNFIDSMLTTVGGMNVAGEFGEQYPRVAMEWLISSRPEVLIDLSPEAGRSLEHWQRWPHIPRSRRGA